MSDKPGAGARPERKDQILVVDDEPDILASLKDLFEASMDNVEVHTCASGREALEVLANHRIDLIVSDYKMPGMNGLEFLDAAQKAAPGVPRILATAFPDLDIAVRAINETGVENFLTKPFEPDQAIETVTRILHERRRDATQKTSFARSMNLMRRKDEKA